MSTLQVFLTVSTALGAFGMVAAVDNPNSYVADEFLHSDYPCCSLRLSCGGVVEDQKDLFTVCVTDFCDLSKRRSLSLPECLVISIPRKLTDCFRGEHGSRTRRSASVAYIQPIFLIGQWLNSFQILRRNPPGRKLRA